MKKLFIMAGLCFGMTHTSYAVNTFEKIVSLIEKLSIINVKSKNFSLRDLNFSGSGRDFFGNLINTGRQNYKVVQAEKTKEASRAAFSEAIEKVLKYTVKPDNFDATFTVLLDKIAEVIPPNTTDWFIDQFDTTSDPELFRTLFIKLMNLLEFDLNDEHCRALSFFSCCVGEKVRQHLILHAAEYVVTEYSPLNVKDKDKALNFQQLFVGRIIKTHEDDFKIYNEAGSSDKATANQLLEIELKNEEFKKQFNALEKKFNEKKNGVAAANLQARNLLDQKMDQIGEFLNQTNEGIKDFSRQYHELLETIAPNGILDQLSEDEKKNLPNGVRVFFQNLQTAVEQKTKQMKDPANTFGVCMTNINRAIDQVKKSKSNLAEFHKLEKQ